ncbi:MAG: hypothetical protein RMK29_12345 [Myxococcales bacterium]|nr:hypothetical protein [Myxococcota bacterium]MDW8282495.1 hypothetical protein [Myxococcales bacterium]
MRCLPAVLLMAVLLTGCRTRDLDRQPFIILVQAKAHDFRPVEGLVVATPGGVELARTNSDGRALFSAAGQEGESVEFIVQPPPGMLISEGGERRRVLLRRLRSISGGHADINLVDHDVKLRRRKLPYVVLLATNQFAGLPVVVYGVEKTRLNSRGVGMFLHEGLPGDELTVTLLTTSNPRIAPASPQKTFTLPDVPSQLFWRAELELRKQPEKKPIPKRPRSKGPTPI